jgi:integral membrane sensor domain MASE1
MAAAVSRLPRPAGDLLRLALVALAYYIAARLSLGLALVHGQVTPVWPPTGIALVAFLVFGLRTWPAIAVAAFAVNLPLGPSPLGAALIAAGNFHAVPTHRYRHKWRRACRPACRIRSDGLAGRCRP